MKKTLIATAMIAILGVSGSLLAADNEAVKQRIDQLKSEFSLNDQQASRIENILTRSGMTDEDRQAAHAERMAQFEEKRLARMKEMLSLTDEQVTQLKALMDDQQAKLKALHDEHKTRLEAILTADQLKQMQDMRGGMGMHGGPGGKGFGGDMHHGGRHGERHGGMHGHGGDWDN